MKKRELSILGIGAPSILLIAVTVCLAVFCALTLLSARTDALLSRKAFASVRAYYAADAEAQRRISEIDAWLLAGGKMPDIEQSGEYISFDVPVDELHELHVELKTNAGTPRYTLAYYAVVNTAGAAIEQPLHLYGTEE